MDRNFNRILHNIEKYTFFKYLGDVNIYDLEKYEIKDIINAMHKIDKQCNDDANWINDKKYLINCINNYCDVYRCYSLYIE